MSFKPEKVIEPPFLQTDMSNFFCIPVISLPIYPLSHTLMHPSAQTFEHWFCKLIDRQMVDDPVKFRFTEVHSTNIY